MATPRARYLRREKQRVERRRAAEDVQARETQREQAQAALRRELRRSTRRHVIAYVLFVVAGVMAVAHFFEHAGTFTIVSPGFADLFLGWPMAGVLALIGAIVYGR